MEGNSERKRRCRFGKVRINKDVKKQLGGLGSFNIEEKDIIFDK